MLKRCILAENRKLHASPIWAMFFVLPILSATYGTFNYLQNLEILTDGWYSLWTQHTLFYSMLFFPAMVATYAAYLWRLEHLGHNWNLIMASPVPPLDLFAAKFAVVTKLALLTHGFVFALFVFCGKVFAHLPGLPPVTLPLFLLRGLLGALAVIAAQLVLAMVIRSFAVPIFLGLLGGITGIFISSKGFGILWPYSLMQLGMNSNKSAGCSGGQLRAVCLQLHLLAGDDVPSGMAAFTPGGCAGIAQRGEHLHGCPPLFSAVQLLHNLPDLAAGVSLLEQLGADGRITAALTAHPRRAVRHGAAAGNAAFAHLQAGVTRQAAALRRCIGAGFFGSPAGLFLLGCPLALAQVQPLCRKGIADLPLAEFVLIFLLRLLVFVLLLCQLILPQLLLHFLLPCRVGPFGFIGAVACIDVVPGVQQVCLPCCPDPWCR